MLTLAPCCTHRHTPCGSLAPNSTSPALLCLPLVHRNPAPYPLNSTKICFSFFIFIFPLHFEPLQDNVATVVPLCALGSLPEPLLLHLRQPRRLHNVLTSLPPPACPHYLGHGNTPLPHSTQATATATAATHHPLYHASSLHLIFGIQAPPHLIPQASQVPIAASAPPHTSLPPAPTPSWHVSPTLSQCTPAHRPFKVCNHPPRHGAQPPTVPATLSRHANTCCICPLMSHKLVLVVSLLYILYYCNEYIF